MKVISLRKISRLRKIRKQASETITLYHTTSSQVLMQIYEDKQILPSGYVDTFANGDGFGNPSPEENAVYLYREDIEKHLKSLYQSNAVFNTHFNEDLPNFSVNLEIEVEIEYLGPDYKDYNYFYNGEFENEDEKWKESLDKIQQVVHYGPISIDNIKSVTILSNNIVFGNILEDLIDNYFVEDNPKFKDDDEAYQAFQDFFYGSLKFDTKLSVDEAVSMISNFYNKLYKKQRELQNLK